MGKTIFISYRREDEGSATRFLKAELESQFGQDQVFMDVDNIRSGEKWAEHLNQKLYEADVLICVIGKNWLKLHDEFYRRRLDNANDWVRREIEISIERKIVIIPLLMGTSLPRSEALPEAIKELADFQCQHLSAHNWPTDMSALFESLIQLGIESKNPKKFSYPKLTVEQKKQLTFPLPFNAQELTEELKKLDGWKIREFPFHDATPDKGVIIEKHYLFDSFEKAIQFMNRVSDFISKTNHHPEWTNTWNTVIVRLSSWDIEHKITALDINLAEYLDKEYKAFHD